jgi:hypothetical protein
MPVPREENAFRRELNRPPCVLELLGLVNPVLGVNLEERTDNFRVLNESKRHEVKEAVTRQGDDIITGRTHRRKNGAENGK